MVRNPIVASRFQHSVGVQVRTSILYFICFKYFVKAVGTVTVIYCWIIYLKKIVRNPIVASRFQHSVGVQLPAFYILFVLNIS